MSLRNRPLLIGTLVGKLWAEITRLALMLPKDFLSGTKFTFAKSAVWFTVK